METKQIVNSNSNVILTRQTCGQRSCMSAACRCRALAFYFSVQIGFTFLISKCRGESDLGLCMTWDLHRACRCTVPTSDSKTCLAAESVGRRHCAAACSLQVLKSCTHLHPTHLYISILGTYSKFVRKNKMHALGVYMLQPCPSAGRRFAASRSRLYCYWQFVSFPQQRIRWNTL